MDHGEPAYRPGWLDRFSIRQLLSMWMVFVLVVWMGTLATDLWTSYRVQGRSGEPWAEPVQEAQNARIQFLKLLLSISGLGATILLGRAILRHTDRRIGDLAEMARHMEMRDFREYPGFIPKGELGEVAQAFRDMRQAIEGYEREQWAAMDMLRESNHQLGQREAFLRALVESAPVGIFTMDPDSTITRINPFLERFLGYTAEELVGKCKGAIWVDPEDARAFLRKASEFYGRPITAGRSLYEALDSNLPLPPQEVNFLRKDGRKVPAMTALTSLRSQDGARVGTLGVITDMTVIKALEMELREREADAQAANLAKSTFLAAMSHEVRTPLIGITGMLEILALSRLDLEQRKAVNIIEHSAQSLLQIIGGILDFSKIEAGKLELVPETLCIRDLAEAVAYAFARAASSKGLRLTHEVDERIARAHVADPLRLRQILNNFLSNAVKFTEAGSVVFRVRLLGAAQGSETLAFEVQDTGIGISPENQSKLFEPFSQAEASTTRRFGGTGLGLTISRRLLEMMGGTLSMQSAVGVGTILTFTATFPLGDPKDILQSETLEAAPPVLRFRPAPSVEEAEREGSLILLVEDHPTNRTVLARQVNLAGFALEVVEDGEAAFESWKSGRFALILSDLHMPRMDGYQLTAAIRRQEQNQGSPPTPILALTANALKGEAERCLAMGMDDYLTKPVGIRMLGAKLRQWLPHLRLEDGITSTEPEINGGCLQFLFDQTVLLTLCGEDPAAAASLLEEFLTATRADLQGLAEHLLHQDRPSLIRQAHRIKGASAMIGAREVAKRAGGLESAARGAEWETIETHVTWVLEAFEGLMRDSGLAEHPAPTVSRERTTLPTWT